jgi:hypothetical protein
MAGNYPGSSLQKEKGPVSDRPFSLGKESQAKDQRKPAM